MRGFGQVEQPFNSEPVELPEVESNPVELPNTDADAEKGLSEEEYTTIKKIMKASISC